MQEILRSLLQEAVDRSGYTIPEITEMLHRERTWLYRLLSTSTSTSRPVRFEHIEEIYGALRIPIADFFAACLEVLKSPHLAAKSDVASNPVALLRILRGDADPALGWLEQFRTSRVSQPRSEMSVPLHRSVRRIDDAREFDRQAALVDAEQWLRSFERRCKRRRLSAQETSQLATALGVWASIQRARGHQALGLKALELAWELHGENPWLASCADLLERSSMAIYEHGYPRLGVPLMQRAYAIAFLVGDKHREAKALLGMGILAFRSGNEERACSAFKQVLEHPGADSFRCASAANFLISEYERRDDLKTAQKYLVQVSSYLPDLPAIAQLSLRAKEAQLLRKLGDLEGALAVHEENFAMARLFSPLDRAVVLLHIFEIQVELGRLHALPSYSGHLSSLIEELEETPLSQGILRSLHGRIRRGQEFQVREIVEMRLGIGEERSGKESYPTGSHSG